MVGSLVSLLFNALSFLSLYKIYIRIGNTRNQYKWAILLQQFVTFGWLLTPPRAYLLVAIDRALTGTPGVRSVQALVKWPKL